MVNPDIEIKKSNLSCDQRTGRQFHAFTDKGMVYGSTEDVVQRKIERMGANPYKLPKQEPKKAIQEDWKVPF